MPLFEYFVDVNSMILSRCYYKSSMLWSVLVSSQGTDRRGNDNRTKDVVPFLTPGYKEKGSKNIQICVDVIVSSKE